MLAGVPARGGTPADIAGPPVLVFTLAILMADVDVGSVQIEHDAVLFMNMHGTGLRYVRVNNGNNADEFVVNRDTALRESRKTSEEQADEQATGTEHD